MSHDWTSALSAWCPFHFSLVETGHRSGRGGEGSEGDTPRERRRDAGQPASRSRRAIKSQCYYLPKDKNEVACRALCVRTGRSLGHSTSALLFEGSPSPVPPPPHPCPHSPLPSQHILPLTSRLFIYLFALCERRGRRLGVKGAGRGRGQGWATVKLAAGGGGERGEGKTGREKERERKNPRRSQPSLKTFCAFVCRRFDLRSADWSD